MNIWKKLLAALCFLLIVGLCVQIIVPESIYSVTTAQASTKVKLNKKKATLTVGDTLQLKISGTKSKVSWSSSNKTVAKVSKKGKITALKAGKATIIAKVNREKYKCKINVVNLNKTKATLTVDDTLQLKVLGTTSKVTWSSSNKSVVKVSKKGKVTAIKAGKATITAKVEGVKCKCKITVKKLGGTYTGELIRFIGKSIKDFNSVVADPIPSSNKSYDNYYNEFFTLFCNSTGTIHGMRLESGYNTYTLLGVYPGMKYNDAHAALIGNDFLLTGGNSLSLIYSESETYPNTQVILKRNTTINGGVIKSIEFSINK